jgi:hypothetical protein
MRMKIKVLKCDVKKKKKKKKNHNSQECVIDFVKMSAPVSDLKEINPLYC